VFIFAGIRTYSEKQRFYHDLSHLSAVLECFGQLENMADEKHLVELALWFHDAIYQPFSKGNENKSADWACHFLEINGVNHEAQEYVRELIMATCHSGQAESNDQKMVVDIDLSILGADKHRYKKYTEAVRREYAQVPGLIYQRKRKALLNDFLARERIYHFDYFSQKFESQARCNLIREINSL